MKPKNGQKRPTQWGNTETLKARGRTWVVPLSSTKTIASSTGVYQEVARRLAENPNARLPTTELATQYNVHRSTVKKAAVWFRNANGLPKRKKGGPNNRYPPQVKEAIEREIMTELQRTDKVKIVEIAARVAQKTQTIVSPNKIYVEFERIKTNPKATIDYDWQYSTDKLERELTRRGLIGKRKIAKTKRTPLSAGSIIWKR